MHAKPLCDTTCAIPYIRNMGGSQSVECNEIAHKNWLWCLERQMWLTILHIPGVLYSQADKWPRKFHDKTEWPLDPNIFKWLAEAVLSDIDLFASRLNCQIHPFTSWGPDPESVAVDAFTINWSRWATIYAFPPFSLIQKMLGKLQKGQVEGLFIIPHWLTVGLYPQMLKLLIWRPILLPWGKGILQFEHSDAAYPLHRLLLLLAVYLSGKQSRCKAFKAEPVKSSVCPGGSPSRESMLPTFPAGTSSVLKELWSPSSSCGICVRISDKTVWWRTRL